MKKIIREIEDADKLRGFLEVFEIPFNLEYAIGGEEIPKWEFEWNPETTNGAMAELKKLLRGKS